METRSGTGTTPLRAAVHEYLEARQASGASANTLKAYRLDLLKDFLPFIERHAPDADAPDLVTETHVLEWISYMELRELKPKTIERKLMVLFGFFKRTIDPERNPVAGSTRRKVPRYLPEVLTEREARRLLEMVDTRTWLGLRNSAILELMYASGMRVAEISGLNVMDIDLANLQVNVLNGKGGRQRRVAFSQHARTALRHLFAYRGPDAPDRLPSAGDAVFLSRSGGRLGVRNIARTVTHAALDAGLSKHVTPHTLRHSFATHLIENGADISSIKMLLGHRTTRTTTIYTHISAEKLRREFNLAHSRYH